MQEMTKRQRESKGGVTKKKKRKKKEKMKMKMKTKWEKQMTKK